MLSEYPASPAIARGDRETGDGDPKHRRFCAKDCLKYLVDLAVVGAFHRMPCLRQRWQSRRLPGHDYGNEAALSGGNMTRENKPEYNELDTSGETETHMTWTG